MRRALRREPDVRMVADLVSSCERLLEKHRIEAVVGFARWTNPSLVSAARVDGPDEDDDLPEGPCAHSPDGGDGERRERACLEAAIRADGPDSKRVADVRNEVVREIIERHVNEGNASVAREAAAVFPWPALDVEVFKPRAKSRAELSLRRLGGAESAMSVRASVGGRAHVHLAHWVFASGDVRLVVDHDAVTRVCRAVRDGMTLEIEGGRMKKTSELPRTLELYGARK